MDELAQARVELTLLEEKARQLLEQLLDVRTTIATQRAKIDELSRTNLKLSPINHIPTEILVFILDLDFYAHDYLERKKELASVCRRWRDVILRTPCFWSTIYLALDESSINTHLERSRGTLLDIVIECAPSTSPEYLEFVPGLDIVMACAHRWRSLLVIAKDDSSDDNPYDDGEEPPVHFIADRINHLYFPSLKSVTIFALCDVGYLDFLSIGRAPALEHLELDEFMTDHDVVNPVAMLKTLKLDLSFTNHLSFWSLVPTQALTKLSLSGETTWFLLQPNSIYFPSLMWLEMDHVTKTRPILAAIVVPNLEQFNYSPSQYDDSVSVAFGGFRSKFTNVRQLSFSGRWGVRHSDTMRLCEAFPGVHHVELIGQNWPFLFDPPPIQFEPGSDSHIRFPMDFWTELKSLTFNGLHPKWLEHDRFTAWLVHRRASSPQQLHVKVKGSHRSKAGRYIDQRSIRPYEHLKENCILELDGFSSTDFSVPGDSSLRGVSSFHKMSSGNSTHLDLAFTGANKASGRDRRSVLSWRCWSWQVIMR